MCFALARVGTAPVCLPDIGLEHIRGFLRGPSGEGTITAHPRGRHHPWIPFRADDLRLERRCGGVPAGSKPASIFPTARSAVHDPQFDPPTAISFREDSIDLARTARSILGVDVAGGPVLLAVIRLSTLIPSAREDDPSRCRVTY